MRIVVTCVNERHFSCFSLIFSIFSFHLISFFLFVIIFLFALIALWWPYCKVDFICGCDGCVSTFYNIATICKRSKTHHDTVSANSRFPIAQIEKCIWNGKKHSQYKKKHTTKIIIVVYRNGRLNLAPQQKQEKNKRKKQFISNFN